MKMVFDLDLEKCTACGACAVACMDQNDIYPDKGDAPFRRVGSVNPFRPEENPDLGYISLACMHCADAPCIPACLVGCLFKDEMNLTLFDNTRCIGCHSCAMACPFGAPTYRSDGKMRKCDGCSERLKAGLLPACVRACSYGALTCVPEEEYARKHTDRSLRSIMNKTAR